MIFVLLDEETGLAIKMRAPRLQRDPIIGFSSPSLAEGFCRGLGARRIRDARLPLGTKENIVLFHSQEQIARYQADPRAFRYENVIVPSLRGAARYIPKAVLQLLSASARAPGADNGV